MHDWWPRILTRELTRLRNDGRAALLWSLRITVAAVASYVVGTLFFPGTQPLLAPLTAMLVVQVTPVSLLASGLDRVVAVVTGVSLAVAFAAVVPLEWWSLGLLIFVSITIGQVLRLRSNLIEVAISGMLVLGVGSLGAEPAAWQRIAETLVGAAVGIAANLLFPPKVASADAGRAIDGLADSVSDLLTRAADELTELVAEGRDLAPPRGRGWARRAASPTTSPGWVPRCCTPSRAAGSTSAPSARPTWGRDSGRASRRWSTPRSRSAGCSVPWRTRRTTRPGSTTRAPRTCCSGWRRRSARWPPASTRSGSWCGTRPTPRTGSPRLDVQALREALEGLHEARARLDDLMTAACRPELLELHAAVLSTVQRLLTRDGPRRAGAATGPAGAPHAAAPVRAPTHRRRATGRQSPRSPPPRRRPR